MAAYKAQSRLFLTLSNILITINLPWIIYNFLIGGQPTMANQYLQIITDTLTVLLVLWVFIAITQVVARDQTHERSTLGEVLIEPRHAFWRMLGVIGLMVFALLIPVACTTLIMVLVLTAVRLIVGLSASNLFASFIPLAVLVTITLSATFLSLAPTCTIIDGGLTKALQQSFMLIRGRFWRTFGRFLLLYLIIQGLPLAVSVMYYFNIIGTSFNTMLLIKTIAWLYGVLVFPLAVIFTTLMYLRLKDSLKARG